MKTRLSLSSVPMLVAAAAVNLTAAAETQPLHHWTMAEENLTGHVLAAEAGPDGLVLQEPQVEDGALLLEGDNRIDVPEVTPADLPKEQLSVEAWVAIDQGQEWGSIVGLFQDNGSYERGWSLGYDNSRFMFWLSTGGALVKISSSTAYVAGQWYHLAASYDGREMKLYVNGKLETTGSGARGNIAYPDKGFYTLGAYRDDNELYPMHGKLRDVRVYNAVVPESRFAENGAAAQRAVTGRGLEYAVRPALRFTSPSTALVTWETTDGGAGAVNFGTTRKLGNILPAERDGDGMRVTVTGLQPNTLYYYKIGEMRDRKRIMSRTYEFNTAMNYTVAAVQPSGKGTGPAPALPEQILRQSAVTRGYAVLLAEAGHLAPELAAHSELSVFVFDTDATRVDALRRQWLASGAYGHRISITAVDDCENLPVTSCFANLVVAPERLRSPEIDRMLAPGTGRACFLDARGQVTETLARPALKEAGQWTHQYGDAGNTTNAGESLGGASSTHDLTLQWIGRPGGDFGIDRQSRMPAPLAAGGRLYHQGMSRLITLDAYNGSVLWGLEIPDLRRLNMPRDASNWCADADNLYVAVEERAWILEGATGRRLATLQPAPLKSGQRLNWGYIGRSGNRLFGSSTRANSVYVRFWGGDAWFDGKQGEGTGKVCSDNFFAVDLADHSTAWTYQDGVILNPTIAMGDGRVFFVECRHPAIVASATRQVADAALWQDQYLVALDAETGQKLWEQPIDTVDGITSFYLQYSPQGVVVTASNQQFHIYNYNPANGELQWETANPWPDDHHSGHIQHPVIVGDTLYLQPNGYSMVTGEVVTTNVGQRSGCTTYIGVRDALIYRGAARQVAMWDRETEKVTAWERLRPSCWLSVIAAEGMVLVPEGGGGCSCGGWMETSLVLAPRSLVTPREEAR